MSKRFGKIAVFKQAAGYGFIYEGDNKPGQKMVAHFFHIRYCEFIPAPGQKVFFDLVPGPAGKGPMAVNIELDDRDTAMAILSGNGGGQ